jgi:hypothetical protein
MSVQHHGSPEEQAATRRMLDEFLGNAKPRFPDGKLSDDDQGELAFAIASDKVKNVVVIRFTKPVDWLGLDKRTTLLLANLLLEKSKEIL